MCMEVGKNKLEDIRKAADSTLVGMGVRAKQKVWEAATKSSSPRP